jgi:hypothetical protein
MPNYKAQDNSIHFIAENYANLLPSGCIQITDEEAEALRPKPDLTAQAIAAIEKQRDDALNAGFLHNGVLYHCDPTFQSQLQAFLLAWAVGMLAPAATVSIRRHDNVTETMTKDQVGALAGALMAYVQGVYAASWNAKDSLP